MNIWPEPGSRSIFIGKTGSGKTFGMLKTAHRFLHERQIQLLATKEDKGILSLPYPIVNKLSEVSKYKFPDYPFVIYYPMGDELADKEKLDRWCEWVYQRKHTVAMIDEVTQVADKVRPRPGFLDLYTRGRSQDITVLAGNQRPVGLPVVALSEAEHFYRFYLARREDRKTVSDYTHPVMLQQVRDKHGFFYYSPNRSNNVFYIKSL